MRSSQKDELNREDIDRIKRVLERSIDSATVCKTGKDDLRIGLQAVTRVLERTAGIGVSNPVGHQATGDVDDISENNLAKAQRLAIDRLVLKRGIIAERIDGNNRNMKADVLRELDALRTYIGGLTIDRINSA